MFFIEYAHLHEGQKIQFDGLHFHAVVRNEALLVSDGRQSVEFDLAEVLEKIKTKALCGSESKGWLYCTIDAKNGVVTKKQNSFSAMLQVQEPDSYYQSHDTTKLKAVLLVKAKNKMTCLPDM